MFSMNGDHEKETLKAKQWHGFSVSSLTKNALDWFVRVVVVASIAWAGVTAFLLLRHVLTPKPSLDLRSQTTYPVLDLPIVSSADLYNEDMPLVGLMEAFLDTTRGAARICVVYNSDHTGYVELDYVLDCGCSSAKVNRYTLSRHVYNPLTGAFLATLEEKNLSAEGLNRYFGGQTQIGRYGE